MRLPAACLALAAALVLAGQGPAFAESDTAPQTCAGSETGFVAGAPCFSLGGRMYAARPTDAVEAQLLDGPIKPENYGAGTIPLAALDAPMVPTVVVSDPVRDGRVINLGVRDPAPNSLVLFRTPASFPDDHAQEVRIRTAGAGDVAAVVRSLTDAGGSPVKWRHLGANRWYLAFFVNDWRLLNWAVP